MGLDSRIVHRQPTVIVIGTNADPGLIKISIGSQKSDQGKDGCSDVLAEAVGVSAGARPLNACRQPVCRSFGRSLHLDIVIATHVIEHSGAQFGFLYFESADSTLNLVGAALFYP
tara:strand:- start:666 stop:1010 length:345 start_codon:yes stop_codon:yes gene_type:complete